jgi:hypothetical protein
MMMTTPAIFPRMRSRSITNCPSALAVAPSVTNTIENPRMKQSEVRTTRRRVAGGAATATAAPEAAVPCRSSSVTPEMNDR